MALPVTMLVTTITTLYGLTTYIDNHFTLSDSSVNVLLHVPCLHHALLITFL